MRNLFERLKPELKEAKLKYFDNNNLSTLKDEFITELSSNCYVGELRYRFISDLQNTLVCELSKTAHDIIAMSNYFENE